jgi:hypothetical protein
MGSSSKQPEDLKIEPGQWVGWSAIEGSKGAFSLINIESRTPDLALVIGVEPQSQFRSVSTGSIFRDGATIKGETWNFHVFDEATDSFLPLLEFTKRNNYDQPVPTRTHYTAIYDGKTLKGKYTNDINQNGKFELWRGFPAPGTAALLPPEGPMTWDEFKKRIASFKPSDGLLFRGQHSNAYPLTTSFHRTGRNNMLRYFDDIERLRHHVNAISQRYYSTSREDLLALLSLAQHHGFPTPLLDWTSSPYVSAFFAFNLFNNSPNFEPPAVRIFIFDRVEWAQLKRQQATSIKDPWPDLQFLHPPAHNNPRYYPQQSMAAFSNVEDIEGFIASVEAKSPKRFLRRFDIHGTERKKAECDLRFMGITAASLFPGFDGICRSLRAELF